jgi:hypothetical protein
MCLSIGKHFSEFPLLRQEKPSLGTLLVAQKKYREAVTAGCGTAYRKTHATSQAEALCKRLLD